MSTIPLNNTHKRRAKTPSFSSILLDSIYRSIDDADASSCHTTINSSSSHKHAVEQQRSSRSRSRMRSDSSTLETVDLRRAIMIDSWMDKHQPLDHQDVGDNIRIVRQKSVPTRSTAMDSSSCFTSSSKIRFDHHAPKRESSSRIFTKTKSRALKIYGDLKKSKQPQQQPISPGGRIAAFLNSFFRNSGGSPARSAPIPATSTSTSTCSSASSFSRSCLSKTPSSRGKSSTAGTKRSVRFYPVSVIVDEDSQPCGHKSLYKNDDDSMNDHLNNNNQRKSRREKEIESLMMIIKRNCGQDHGGISSLDCDTEEDDGESCASSDLFELQNLSSVGISRYTEELPVYGTTSLENLTP